MIDVFAPYDANQTQPSYEETYADTLSKLGSPNYSFSMEDLRADVDAVNLANKQGIWAEIIRAYYEEDAENRYGNFVKNETGKDATKEIIVELVDTYTKATYMTQGWPLLGGHDVTGEQQRAFSEAFADFIMELINDKT